MYHLYTVDILCTGLPVADFNTLEFEHPDKAGNRKLKYVHAWVWMEWTQIQRYLFEGSTMKERKEQGSFQNAREMQGWLEHFNLDLEAWGCDHYKSVEDLFAELENNESHLELWGRQDGVPLLMRVLHVLQLKVCSTDSRLQGKFIYHTWTQRMDGRHQVVHRLMNKKLTIGKTSVDKAVLVAHAESVVKQQLSYVMDPHFRLDPENMPKLETLEACQLKVHKVTFQDHRVDVDNSPRFKGLCTLYHLYTLEVECEGLPHANFASLCVVNPLDSLTKKSPGQSEAQGGVYKCVDLNKLEPYIHAVYGWCWVVLPQCMDMAHARNSELEEQLDTYRKAIDAQNRLIQSKADSTGSMVKELKRIVSDPKEKVPKNVLTKVEQLLEENRDRESSELAKAAQITTAVKTNQISRRLPPSMVSEMAEGALVSDDLFISLKESEAEKPPERKFCGFAWCRYP
jgi:hypothetical protein